MRSRYETVRGVNAIAPRAQTRLTEGGREWTAEQLANRSPDYTAALVIWLCSPEAKSISGRIFESWGLGYGVVESWQHGPTAPASLDPTTIGDSIRKIVRYARANAGIDPNTWLEP